MKHSVIETKKNLKNNEDSDNDNLVYYETNPLAIGNLFESSWYKSNQDELSRTKNVLNTTLLTYYIENGYGCCIKHNNEQNNELMNQSYNQNQLEKGRRILRKVMLETASRGDIEGMWFMSKQGYFHLNDTEICTMAGAAGHLEALKWLRGDIQIHGMINVCCPWNPTEVHREAAENSHDHIIEYVEKNCDGHDIQMHYGVGLPW